ncbi:DUF4129 domain-containing protein [Chryseobacterium sp. PTM-20240506]|uniref:DUF4129 domain-containing protein n=1 Tax=unclassified Chryseobacterium TaxID=2593645 RepID=UPI0023597CFF|nr:MULTISPECIES: DUF4129 domain-containing protein [unclassified Chryseobacterium]MDC8106488.1 DUF4129 domain-containing protein [Chryseobacterium sp. B21-037]MDQ1804991.1 DUF4129 domain-containing protein [Chryseobacterium sp. CKR4-1]
MNKIIFFLLIFFSTGFVYAQDDIELPPEAYVEDSLSTGHYKNMYRADSVLMEHPVSENTIYPKKFRENLKSRYKGNEFDYTTIKPRESFWQKLQRKIARILEGIFGEDTFGTSAKVTTIVMRLFAIVLIGFLLYFIVRYLISKDGNFFFGKKNKKVNINEEELHENIHEINFPESIAKFEVTGDYRSAVRYQFLYVLKKLSDKKLIIWNPEKTNKDYAAELKAEYLKKEFSNLSYIFDYVWYGEFSITEQDYLKFKNQYQTFKP